MCMSIEYHLYLLHFFYHVNDYNIVIIFVCMFMDGSMSAVMLLLCYLPMTMIMIKLYIVLYCMYIVQSHNCISNIFVIVSIIPSVTYPAPLGTKLSHAM